MKEKKLTLITIYVGGERRSRFIELAPDEDGYYRVSCAQVEKHFNLKRGEAYYLV